MALKLNERYPGRFDSPSADYPQGSFKNRTTPTAKDGSYLEKDWANDKEGFFQSLLSEAGIVADGDVDKVGASQYYEALLGTILSQASGRLMGEPQIFTVSGTYTPTAGMRFCLVEVQGAGGNGGGAPSTTAGQLSLGGGGASGAYSKGILTDVQVGVSQSVIVGVAGAPNAGNGVSGGASSIGALISAPGGGGGAGLASVTSTTVSVVSGGLSSSSGSGGSLINATGQNGSAGHITANGVLSGFGAGSPIAGGGGGGRSAGVGNSGNAATSAGAGGGGACNNVSSAAKLGGQAANGLVIIWEFS